MPISKLFSLTKREFLASLGLIAIATSNLCLAQGTAPRYKISPSNDDSPTETAMEIDDGALLGYGGFRYGTAYMDGKFLPTAGLRGMWLFKEILGLGIDFTSLTGRYHPYKTSDRKDWTQSLTTWGATVLHSSKPRREFSCQYGLTIGRGIARLENPSIIIDTVLEKPKTFFMVAPEANLQWNFTKYTRMFVGIHAMLPFGSEGNSEIKDSGLSRVYTYLGVNVGNFTL